jgi:hypothetical protein
MTPESPNIGVIDTVQSQQLGVICISWSLKSVVSWKPLSRDEVKEIHVLQLNNFMADTPGAHFKSFEVLLFCLKGPVGPS